jgi:hypothetical protein
MSETVKKVGIDTLAALQSISKLKIFSMFTTSEKAQFELGWV